MVVLPAMDFWIINKYKTIQCPNLISFCVCWCSELNVNLFIFVEFWNPELHCISFLNNFVLKIWCGMILPAFTAHQVCGHNKISCITKLFQDHSGECFVRLYSNWNTFDLTCWGWNVTLWILLKTQLWMFSFGAGSTWLKMVHWIRWIDKTWNSCGSESG